MTTTLALITGTSRGIGAGIAAAAAMSGALVGSCNRTGADGERDLPADLSKPEAWSEVDTWMNRLLDETSAERFVFVHNAATLTPIGFAGEVPAAGYTTNVLLNSAAPQVIGDAVIRAAQRTNTPTTLVQLSSGAGKNPYPGWTSYCASKAAVDMWVRSVALEQADRDDLVRAIAISPGVVDTAMQAEIRSSAPTAFPEVQRFQAMNDGGELGNAADVGRRIWTLAVDGDWPNGAVLNINNLPT